MTDTGWIPARWAHAKLVDFISNKPLYDLLEEVYSAWVAHKKTGLLLHGPWGVGKTHAVCALANDIYATGCIKRPPIYVGAARLPDLMLEEDDFRDQKWSETLLTAELLLIDDLGKENRATDYRADTSVQKLGLVLRHRVQENKPTFITSNLTWEDIEKTYGKGLASLICEVAPDTRFWVVGPDQRRAK